MEGGLRLMMEGDGPVGGVFGCRVVYVGSRR